MFKEQGMGRRLRDGDDRPRKGRSRVERLLYRVEEAAEAYGCSPRKMYELLDKDEVPWIRLGQSRRVPVEALRQLILTKLAERAGRGTPSE